VPVTLTVGAGRIDRVIHGADEVLRAYEIKGDTGLEYLRYPLISPRDRVVPEDLAVTLLVNSRATARAFQSLRDRGPGIDLSVIPDYPMEQVTDVDLEVMASLIAQMAQWPGLGASIATKVLHKKRPALIPVLDNQAIFGAYMNPRWPGKPSAQESIKSRARILEALRWIRFDVSRPENEPAWPELSTIEPGLSRIELLDSVWWTHFRRVEPAGTRPARGSEG
jgi:hypothetical protein